MPTKDEYEAAYALLLLKYGPQLQPQARRNPPRNVNAVNAKTKRT